MSDLVERLDRVAGQSSYNLRRYSPEHLAALCGEAASEIERLRERAVALEAELASLKDRSVPEGWVAAGGAHYTRRFQTPSGTCTWELHPPAAPVWLCVAFCPSVDDDGSARCYYGRGQTPQAAIAAAEAAEGGDDE